MRFISVCSRISLLFVVLGAGSDCSSPRENPLETDGGKDAGAEIGRDSGSGGAGVQTGGSGGIVASGGRVGTGGMVAGGASGAGTAGGSGGTGDTSSGGTPGSGGGAATGGSGTGTGGVMNNGGRTGSGGTATGGATSSGGTGSGGAPADPCLSNGGCSANATCSPTTGGRTCSCKPGYSGDGLICNDVNECLTANGGCNANAACTNTVGGRTCSCKTGYSGDGLTCNDVNECSTANGGCNANAACTNTAGGRTCDCMTGFTGDGLTCTAVPPPAPISQWKFDKQANPNSILDSVGNNHGTVVTGNYLSPPNATAPTFTADRNGVANGALRLDGVTSSNWVLVPTSSSLNGPWSNNAITMTIWVRVKTLVSQTYLFDRGGTADPTPLSLQITNGNRPTLSLDSDSAPVMGAMPTNTWTFLAGVYNGRDLDFYINGVIASSLIIEGLPLMSGGQPLTIGALRLTIGPPSPYASGFIDGDIDEVRLYGAALTAAQIKTVMQQ